MTVLTLLSLDIAQLQSGAGGQLDGEIAALGQIHGRDAHPVCADLACLSILAYHHAQVGRGVIGVGDHQLTLGVDGGLLDAHAALTVLALDRAANSLRAVGKGQHQLAGRIDGCAENAHAVRAADDAQIDVAAVGQIDDQPALVIQLHILDPHAILAANGIEEVIHRACIALRKRQRVDSLQIPLGHRCGTGSGSGGGLFGVFVFLPFTA